MHYKLSKYFLATRPINEKKDRIGYSTRSCKSLLLSNAVFNEISNDNFNIIPESIINKLLDIKFLIDIDEDELNSIVFENKNITESNKKNLYEVIQITANCQLDCNYCGQTHSNFTISDNVIKLIVERIKYKIVVSECKSVVISWFGGEPLLALDKINEISSDLITFCENNSVKYGSKLSSNGLLLNIENYKILSQELKVKEIEVTLDGTKEYHDNSRYSKNGKGSFEIIFNNLIEIAKFKNEHETENLCKIKIRCNVNIANAKGVSKLIKLLSEHQLNKHYEFYVKGIYSWAQNNADKDSFSPEQFAQKEIEWMKEMKLNGFKLSGMPVRMNISCLATSPTSEMFDPFGNVFCCTETSLTDIYKNSIFNLGSLPNPKANILPSNWNAEIADGKFPCKNCHVFPICGGSCPKSWFEGGIPCISHKFNLEERLLLAFSDIVD